MEEFLSENDYNKTILGYRVGNTFIDVKYEDCIKRYEYSLRLEKLILSQMEKQIEQKFEEEYDDKKVNLERQFLYTIMESVCTVGFGAQCIISNDTVLSGVTLFCAGVAVANGCYALIKNNELNKLEKINFFVTHKDMLKKHGLTVNTASNKSLRKLKKLTRK